MLPDDQLELLTAFVDGELTPRQRLEATRLLEHSSEARDVLRQLQENAFKLKQLPRRKVEPSLVEAVMEAIAEQKAQPRQPVKSGRGRRRWLPYVAASLAASLLIGVIGILYWQAMNRPDETIAVIPPNKKPEQPAPIPQKTPKSNPLLDQLVLGTFTEFGRTVPVDAPFSATFAELKDGKKSIARELAVDKPVQLDITVKNNALAMGRLKEVLGARGITLVTDPSAAKALGEKNQTKVRYLVYAENLAPDEVTKMMSELGETFVMPGTNNQKNVASPYHEVTVKPIAKEENEHLSKLLGKPTRSNGEPAKRQAVVLPTNAAGTPSAEVAKFAQQRVAPKPGTVQVLIRIQQE